MRQGDDAVSGVDVSAQGPTEADWTSHWQQGKRFAYVLATEGVDHVNPGFGVQYAESFDVGLIRGAYHFALPDRSSGADQAEFFVDNGGAWKADGMTLPGALNLEFNPYGKACYGLTRAALSDWVLDFADTYLEWTGRYPVVYTSAVWWAQCAGAEAGPVNPLRVDMHSATPGAFPRGRGVYPVWHRPSPTVERGPRDRLLALVGD
ncbi:GH25 family lysozyme [Umezawaea endophytica]|uniref:GH25 family lysozyme n=1 Tax=Umezawaea endophytica TaxID=1654476 RepID=UPI0027E23F6F|nr:GH25 family lysozyme [Umezawaea endophytica]